MGDEEAVLWELLARAQAHLLAEAPPPPPAQPDALALAGAQLSLLGAELTPCRSADDVAALLTAVARYPEGTHNRARRIGDDLHISTFEVVVRVQLSRTKAREQPFHLVRRALVAHKPGADDKGSKVRRRQPVAEEGAAEAKQVCLAQMIRLHRVA